MGLLPMDLDILPPSDDRIFKLLLTSPEAKPGLMNLISSIIGREVVDLNLLANEIPVGDTDEKAERFDVNCKIDDDSQINLEMQASRIEEDSDGQFRNLKGKSIYYLTDLHSSQPSKGLRRYDRLARSYQITFCSYTVFPNTTEYINSFSMRNDRTNELLIEAIHATFVELSKLNEIIEKPVSDMSPLDKWSVFLRYAQDPQHRKTVNQVIESEEVLSVAGELLMSISQSEQERAIFRSRRKYQTDLQSNLATAEDRGKEIGIEIGKEIGKEIGREMGKEIGISMGVKQRNVEIAQNLMNMGISINQIVTATGLSTEEVERLKLEN